MRTKIRFLSFLMAAVVFMLTPVYAQASTSMVGEYVSLHSGGALDSLTGSSDVNVLTEEQRQANSTNSTASRTIQHKVGQIISSYQVEEGHVIQEAGSYIFIIDQKQLEKRRSTALQ